MKKSILLFISLAIAIWMMPACKDKKGCTNSNALNYDSEAEEDDGSCKLGGIGGNTTIVAKPQHHGAPIISGVGYVDSAFVKFNTEDSPGLTADKFDLVVAGEEGEDHVHIEDLKAGKYFIMMTGFDSTINQRVIGGIPYTLTQESGEVDVEVPVTEGD